MGSKKLQASHSFARPFGSLFFCPWGFSLFLEADNKILPTTGYLHAVYCRGRDAIEGLKTMASGQVMNRPRI